jgi:hypothetical protein
MAKKGRSLKLERSNIEFPLWRKKVDASLFEQAGTTIPNWACKMWDIPLTFQHCRQKNDPAARVTILFEDSRFPGWVTVAPEGRKTPAYRLWYEEELATKLKYTFLMSYMRSLEGALSNNSSEIEIKIPFWEFLDIEYDNVRREFKFVAYYKQEPSFPQLFRRLVTSPALKVVADELSKKEKDRIHKQGWKPRDEYKTEIGAENVIYTLIDTNNKLLYIGEARKLIPRFDRGHTEIKDWDYYKYSVLPASLDEHRITLERMAIREMAALLPNSQNIETKLISNYKLVNRRIDKK